MDKEILEQFKEQLITKKEEIVITSYSIHYTKLYDILLSIETGDRLNRFSFAL